MYLHDFVCFYQFVCAFFSKQTVLFLKVKNLFAYNVMKPYRKSVQQSLP